MSQPHTYFNLAELIFESLEGTITPPRGEELTKLISADQKAITYYLDFVRVYAQLACRDNSAAISNPSDKQQDEILFSDLWQELAQIENTAEAVEIAEPNNDIIIDNTPVKLKREVSKMSVASLILSAAALLFIMILVMRTPVKLPVAVLTESINAKWLEHETIENFQVLHEGTMELKTGIAKITFEYGAEVIVEAPAKFEINGFEKMKLLHGKVFATVPEHAKGFTIETPNSTIIDLGTEFGVKVDSTGKTDVHMFTGKASLIPGMKGHTGSTQDLLAGDAKRVDLSGTIHNLEIDQKEFVRKINANKGIIWRGNDIDLADIVGGGNGFGSGTENIAIHPLTGNHHWVSANLIENYSTLPQKASLTEVRNIPAVDCVFIPDGSRGPVDVSTTGHQWTTCPDTNGLCHWGIGCNLYYLHSQHKGKYFPVIIDGINYVTGEHRSINMCSNLGVTFDLNVIRDQIPNLSISSFKSICGISDNTLNNPKVDCTVLIDGKLAFQKNAMKKHDVENIDIPIQLTSRFLTLIVTESDDSISGDWFAFANPRLVVKPTED